MKYIIRESQFNNVINNVLFEKIKKTITDNTNIYKNIIPNLGNQYYGKKTIQSDAFRHILASAFFTTKLGGKITWAAGQIVELLGALRSFLKSEGFDSGWVMDSANNNIGIELGRKNVNDNINQLEKKVKQIVDKGEFFTGNNIMYKNDKSPKM